MIMRIVGPRSWSLLLIVALGACSTDPPTIEANVFPAEYKKLIVESLKKDKLISAREASITDPTLRQIDTSERYAVCVRYNPRMSELSWVYRSDRAPRLLLSGPHYPVPTGEAGAMFVGGL